MRFFAGLHQPSDAKHFDAAFVSVNRLRNRKGNFAVGDWIMDSGAFTEVSTHGKYRHSVYDYAKQICRWKHNGNLLAAVCQDWMREPWIIKKLAALSVIISVSPLLDTTHCCVVKQVFTYSPYSKDSTRMTT